MRFITVLIMIGSIIACVPISTESTFDAESDAANQDTEQPPNKKQKRRTPLNDPRKIRLLCEYGCPIIPFMEMPDCTDVVDATTADVVGGDVVPPLEDADMLDSVDVGPSFSCEDVYVFDMCCGNGICEDDESAFFCPNDCF